MASPILKYEASAGSGKTYRLALEYLGRLLLAFAQRQNDSPDPREKRRLLGSILAITFTVKAAQEMKERILEKLKRFALSARDRRMTAADREFLAQLAGDTGLAEERICGLSRELIELVLASYEDFNVTTIDSLMSAMVKAVSPDLDLPADYEIAVDAGDELKERGRAMLAALADHDWPRLRAFLEDLRRMGPGVAWRADDAIVNKVATLFRLTLRQESGDAAPGDLGRRMADSWRAFLDRLRPLSPLLREGEPGGKRRRYASGTYLKDALLEQIDQALQDESDLARLEAFVRSAYFRKRDPEELLRKDTPPEFAKRFAAAYRPAQQALRDAVLDFSAYKTLPYRAFLGNFAAAWQAGKQTLFVEEFSRTLAERFAQWRDEAFPYLYLKMSDRFRNFLFDEFQDTSTLQFKALAPLIDEVLSREKKASLFIVGDRKQAIYRWRGGNSELMDEARLRDEVPAIGNLSRGGFSSTLDRNWRSRKEIVGFNNVFWDAANLSRIAAEDELRQAIRENFRDSGQELPAGGDRQGGYVEISLQVAAAELDEEDGGEPEPQADEAGAMSASHLEAVARIIHRLHREHGFAYEQIAVLVRKNAQVRDIVRFLGRGGGPGREKIPTLSDQSLMLDSNRAVNEFIAFLRFLDYPPDDLSFHAFVGGGVFQAEAKNRFPAEMAAFSDDAFIGCRGPFYKRFQEKFPASWSALLEPFFQAVGFLPPYDIFSDFTQVFRVYENFADDTPFLLALGDAVHRCEREGGGSIAGFLGQWRRMVEDEETPTVTLPAGTPGVRVLTMHQSKGLEFPAVIVPVNDRGGRGDNSLHWDPDGLYYINGGMAQAHPRLKEKYQRENIRGTIDLLNLLYVAFTRAQAALFIPVAVKGAIRAPEAPADGLVRKISLASDVVGRHPLLEWFQEGPPRPFQSGVLEKKPSGHRDLPPPLVVTSKKALTRAWQSRYLVFKRADPGERRDRKGVKRGERIHDLLRRLGAVSNPVPLDLRVRELAAAAGWPEPDIQAVTSFLCRADVIRLLARGAEVHLEKEIVRQAGAPPEFRRLDRLQVGADEVLVIDFKTGREKNDEHDAQVRDYVAAVSPLFPGRACRGFLLYIDRGEVREVPCSN